MLHYESMVWCHHGDGVFCSVNAVHYFTVRCWYGVHNLHGMVQCTCFDPAHCVIGCRVAKNESLYSGVCGSEADTTAEVVTFCDCQVTGDSNCGQRLDLTPCPRSDSKLSFWEGQGPISYCYSFWGNRGGVRGQPAAPHLVILIVCCFYSSTRINLHRDSDLINISLAMQL